MGKDKNTYKEVDTMVTFDFNELEGLIDYFNALGIDIGLSENKAIKAAAAVLQPEIARQAPRSAMPRQHGVKDAWRTGEHMADHIYVSRIRSKDRMKFVKVGPSISDNSPYFYAKFHEWGTTKISARPFIQPSVQAKEYEMIEAIKEELRKGLGM